MDNKKWDEVYNSENVAWGKFTSTFLKEVIHMFPQGCKVLDLGCGNGRNLQYLVNNGYNAIGYEFSDIAISQAVTKNIKHKDLVKEEWNIGKFDAVIDFGFYHFYPTDKQKEYFHKLDSVLKQGGIYLNESARLVGSPFKGDNPLGYKPPQLQVSDFDIFDNYYKVLFKEGELPPHGDWKEYPCWQAVYKK